MTAASERWRDPNRECHCRIDVPNAAEEAGYDDADRRLLANVIEYGWHLVQIAESPTSPGWVFSVGMWHTLGSPEIAMFGLDVADAARAINKLGHRVRAGASIGPDSVDREALDGGWPIAFRRVDDSWYRPLFGYALWFARHRPPLPFAQAVWADPSGRFPWDPGFDVAYADDQPSLWIPGSEHPVGRWTGALRLDSWRFADPPATTSFVTTRIARGGIAVLGVVHLMDGTWEFLDGLEIGDADLAVTHLVHLVDEHPEVAELHDLPRGWEAWRAGPASPWERRPSPPDA